MQWPDAALGGLWTLERFQESLQHGQSRAACEEQPLSEVGVVRTMCGMSLRASTGDGEGCEPG